VVDPVYMFTLAGQHAEWASVRQAAVTGNIANAGTSGYTAVEVEPFAKVLAEAGTGMARTQPGHFAIGGGAEGGAPSFGIEDTGGPVALDRELIKAGEANRAFALDVAIVSAFHRMLMASVRSGV